MERYRGLGWNANLQLRAQGIYCTNTLTLADIDKEIFSNHITEFYILSHSADLYT